MNSTHIEVKKYLTQNISESFIKSWAVVFIASCGKAVIQIRSHKPKVRKQNSVVESDGDGVPAVLHRRRGAQMRQWRNMWRMGVAFVARDSHDLFCPRCATSPFLTSLITQAGFDWFRFDQSKTSTPSKFVHPPIFKTRHPATSNNQHTNHFCQHFTIAAASRE